MELETVMSYLANSINPDGVRAQEIKESLEVVFCEEHDPVTQDMVIAILREYQAEGLA
jgi:hypothetical protein